MSGLHILILISYGVNLHLGFGVDNLLAVERLESASEVAVFPELIQVIGIPFEVGLDKERLLLVCW